jgi:hypothetical protein
MADADLDGGVARDERAQLREADDAAGAVVRE